MYHTICMNFEAKIEAGSGQSDGSGSEILVATRAFFALSWIVFLPAVNRFFGIRCIASLDFPAHVSPFCQADRGDLKHGATQ